MISRIAVIILTKNEEVHLERALMSVKSFADTVLVVDSGSTDSTVEIAQSLGADVLFKSWTNYSSQFNFAVNQIHDCDWVLRLDADEFVTETLQHQITTRLDNVAAGVNGIYVERYMNFLGSPVKHGGLFPLHVIRLFRPLAGRCENKWMDEHIVVRGQTIQFSGAIIDDNLKPLSWWIDKHNSYASREAIDILNEEYNFFEIDNLVSIEGCSQAGKKRWLKRNVYLKFPIGMRSFAYFFYRFVIKLGFLDNKLGRQFHMLQGLWYRYLVDCKVQEVKRFSKKNGVTIVEGIKKVLGVDLDA